LLAVTSTATNGLGMGLASTVVMLLSNLTISLLRSLIPQQVRIPIYILVIAGLVTLVDLFMNAWLHEMHKVLGLFIPLIVTNCVILGRAEAFAAKQRPMAALYDGLMMGIGFTWALVLLGGVREVLGSGTLFANASLLLGDQFAWIDTVVFEDYTSVLLMLLPPGGFLVLGFLMAGKRVLERKSRRRETGIIENRTQDTEQSSESAPAAQS
jgi:electron transport complex protein RnfE